MENHLLDGRCSISNIVAENRTRLQYCRTKELAVQRYSQRADANAIVCSIVETAKANNLSVYTYLNILLLYMPGMDYKNYPKVMENMMPWSERVQCECKR